MRRLARRIAGVRILAAEQRPLASRWQGEAKGANAPIPTGSTIKKNEASASFFFIHCESNGISSAEKTAEILGIIPLL